MPEVGTPAMLTHVRHPFRYQHEGENMKDRSVALDTSPKRAQDVTVKFFNREPSQDKDGTETNDVEFRTDNQPPQATVPDGLCCNTWGTLDNPWCSTC
jgi:hypothetical protein